jgi:hypothetical protein
VSAIILKPRREWPVIKGESTTIADLFAKYAVILAAIPAVAGFIGYSIFGRPTLEGYMPISLKENLRWTILSYILSIVSVFLLAYIIDYLAPFFGAKKDLPGSMKIVVYSHTASWLAGSLLIFPELSLFAIVAGFYSLFLLYTGMKSLKEVPPGRMGGYFAAAIFASIIISMGILIVIGLLLGTGN